MKNRKAKGIERSRPPVPAAFSVKNSHTSPKQIELQEKRAEALNLRKQHFTYERIAQHMNEPMSTVHRWVTEAIAAIPMEAAKELLVVELARLNEIQRGVYGRAVEGDLPAIDANLKIMDRRARLLGLYPNRKQDGVSVAVGNGANGTARQTTEIRVSLVRPRANAHAAPPVGDE